MFTRSLSVIVVGAAISAACSACAPTLPPTTVPPQPSPAYEPLKTALQAYVDQTQPFRKEAAQEAERVPGKATAAPAAEQAVRTRQNALADALRTRLRPNAKQGDLVAAPIAAQIVKDINGAFDSPKKDLLIDELAEQNTTPANAAKPAVNQRLEAPRVPPRLMEVLPPLPKQLEYDFAGRTLIIRDIDADVVVDYIPNALPAPMPVSTVKEGAATPQPPGGVSPLAMPQMRGETVFVAMGDMGSGDRSQEAVAQAMVTYFTTARRFGFVVMLGDNLYDDDYTNEFLIPYKPLLDRGVKFYATLGNHDRDLEIHFKPFNMGDKDRYSFDEGNARFAALNSNHPGDPEQLKWLGTVYNDAGDKWRIAFFHHPLYSSGQHSAEGRDVIRPALEQPLVDAKVNVVLSGHEHLYERIKPQKGLQHFVSGGGGRYLYDFHPSAFDDVGLSEHHFMVFDIIGDRLLFEAITHQQKVIDCGILYRTPDAASKKLDDPIAKWLSDCEAAVPGRPRTTAQR
jgi:calcineurin-like phosphoesterase family protein